MLVSDLNCKGKCCFTQIRSDKHFNSSLRDSVTYFQLTLYCIYFCVLRNKLNKELGILPNIYFSTNITVNKLYAHYHICGNLSANWLLWIYFKNSSLPRTTEIWKNIFSVLHFFPSSFLSTFLRIAQDCYQNWSSLSRTALNVEQRSRVKKANIQRNGGNELEVRRPEIRMSLQEKLGKLKKYIFTLMKNWTSQAIFSSLIQTVFPLDSH